MSGQRETTGGPQLPSDAELSTASRDELVTLGTALDGVTIAQALSARRAM